MKNENVQGVADTYNGATRFIKIVGGISLILAPLLSFIGWAIAHDSLSSFFSLNFTWTATDATATIDRSNAVQTFRYYLFPHYFIYASMLFYIGQALCLSFLLYKKSPWHSFLGAILSIIGAAYFIGLLGAFLSIPIGTVIMTNVVKVSFALCVLVFVGNIVQGFALIKTNILAKWQNIFFIVGNILILIFPGVENWMAIGSLLMIIGLLPLTYKFLTRKL
ncbi:MAG: hypothetical protein HYZ42_02465 [Bacteroidetes bacterium]|nr:hypothetical protein [Bacteroidota bacterium]